MKTLVITAELTYDDTLMHEDDEQGIKWFYNDVLKGDLYVHSNEIGDEIGEIRILKVTAKQTKD